MLYFNDDDKLTSNEIDKIKNIINSEINIFLNKMSRKNFKKDNFVMNPLNERFKSYSALARSFDSTLGNTFQNIATQLATHFYGKDFVFAPKAGPDLVILKKDICYIIEIKLGGNLDSKKLPKEFSALRDYYFKEKDGVLWDKFHEIFQFKNCDYYDIELCYCLATIYIENDVKTKLKNYHSKEKKYDEILLLEEEFWNFICNDKKDAFDHIKNAYTRATFKINNFLEKFN